VLDYGFCDRVVCLQMKSILLLRFLALTRQSHLNRKRGVNKPAFSIRAASLMPDSKASLSTLDICSALTVTISPLVEGSVPTTFHFAPMELLRPLILPLVLNVDVLRDVVPVLVCLLPLLFTTGSSSLSSVETRSNTFVLCDMVCVYFGAVDLRL